MSVPARSRKWEKTYFSSDSAWFLDSMTPIMRRPTNIRVPVVRIA